jgi:hypothetical protein
MHGYLFSTTSVGDHQYNGSPADQIMHADLDLEFHQQPYQGETQRGCEYRKFLHMHSYIDGVH